MIKIAGIELYNTKDIANEKGCSIEAVYLSIQKLRHDGKLSLGRGRGKNNNFTLAEKQLIIENIGKKRSIGLKYSKRNKKTT